MVTHTKENGRTGKSHGHGTYEWSNGSKYVGHYMDDKKCGWGVCLHGANEENYAGNYIDGAMHGSGTYTWPNGDEYKGNFINGVKEWLGSVDVKSR